MSFQPSRTETIKTLFHGNRFVIPSYQRKYSWRHEQRKELWEDISENLSMKHFIGTLCFQKDEQAGDVTNEVYEIIDGQQRITTLYILLNVLIEGLAESHPNKADYQSLYIGEGKPKLELLGQDQQFIQRVINQFGKIKFEDIEVRSQIQLYKAKEEFRAFSMDLSDDEREQYIEYVAKKIEILIFNVEDHAQAVKMFTVINDRGLPLSNLDKTKSVLMLYSTIYLNCEMNDLINERFGNIYDLLDHTILLKNKLKVFRTLDEAEFENSFYSQHYYSVKEIFPDWDYQLGAGSIFKQIKRRCEQLKNDRDTLQKFIENYIEDFRKFAQAYSDLFSAVEENKKYEELFQYMEFTATLYPLIVRLKEQGKLDGLLDILEITELRVYKLKNTNPRRNMYLLASEIVENNLSISQIRSRLTEFNENFLNDYRLKDYMNEGVDKKIPLARYLLYKYNKKTFEQEFDLEDFRTLQVEHIFSSSPNYDFKHYGFESADVYHKEISLLGNLTLLEKDLNKKIRNMSPPDKVEGYSDSNIQLNKPLLGKLDKFRKESIATRDTKLVDFFLEEYSIKELA